MKFVIFHGAFASPEAHWFPELQEKLEALNQDVIVPQFPVDEWEIITKAGSSQNSQNQTLTNWFNTFEEFLPDLKKTEKLCFIGHSLGPLFILHVVSKYNLQLDSAIFVSPFLTKLNKSWQIDHVNKSFYKNNFDFEKLKRLIPVSYALFSDNDPYVDKKYSLEFTRKLGSAPIPVKKAGHMNSEVNLNEFPLVYELCKSRIDLTLYQRYIEHRRELYEVDYIKNKSEEVVYLEPEDVFDEGIFKFRNLRKEGFCTLYTAIKYWNTQSTYFKEAQKAARRVSLTRVFVIDKLSDLQRETLLQQIEQDLASNVKVYLCMYGRIKDGVGTPDFGIWDDEYVCIVTADAKNEIKGVKLSSRKEDLTAAKKWQMKIMKIATRIYNTKQDVKAFLETNIIG